MVLLAVWLHDRFFRYIRWERFLAYSWASLDIAMAFLCSIVLTELFCEAGAGFRALLIAPPLVTALLALSFVVRRSEKSLPPHRLKATLLGLPLICVGALLVAFLPFLAP